MQAEYEDGVWVEKIRNLNEYNNDLRSSPNLRHSSLVGLDPDLFPVILAINRTPFAYSVGLSCSGSMLDHSHDPDSGFYGQINSIPLDSSYSSFTDDSPNQGQFWARFDMSNPNSTKLMTDLEHRAMKIEEVPFDVKQACPFGKSFRLAHYYEKGDNMSKYWLTIAFAINDYTSRRVAKSHYDSSSNSSHIGT